MNSKVTPILTVLLVIVSFLAGTLYMRVRNLENSRDTANPGTAQVTVAPQAKIEPTTAPLTDEQKNEIYQSGAGSKGEKDAKVTVVEFSDYQCPFCKRYIDDSYSQIMKDYGDKIRYIFHDYPLSFHANAKAAAMASRCAADQDKYWEYHENLFAKQDDWSSAATDAVTDKFVAYATELGLEAADFKTCVDSKKHEKAVDDDVVLGQKVGVSGTPSFFVNGTMLVGAQPYANFKALIDEALK